MFQVSLEKIFVLETHIETVNGKTGAYPAPVFWGSRLDSNRY